MPTLVTFLLRVFLVLAGLLFAASLAFAFALLLAVWALRAAWAKITGRPVAPFVMHMYPRDGFEQMYRRAAAQASRTPRADAAAGRRVADVTDVEPK
jgi:hypothetical protein